MAGRRLRFDRILFSTAVALTVFGLVMVGSASLFTTLGSSEDGSRFLLRQAIYAIVGFGLMYLFMKIDHRRFNSRGIVAAMVAANLLLLVWVLFTPSINGAHRWIAIGPIHLQASEPAKLALALFLAYTLDRKGDEAADPSRGILPTIAVCGLVAGLVLIEPDTGTAVLMGLVTFIFLYLAGGSLKLLTAMGAGASALLGLVILTSHYRRERFFAFLHPSADPLGAGFQINQSLIALGSGGVAGAGLGQGQQKAFYLPLPYSDFIYAVIGEELGLAGTLAVLIAFGVLLWRGIRTARRAPDNFGATLALALTLILTLQALLNMGVATGLLPTKGLPLPFVSYGGSSLLFALTATGILLNISQHSN